MKAKAYHSSDDERRRRKLEARRVTEVLLKQAVPFVIKLIICQRSKKQASGNKEEKNDTGNDNCIDKIRYMNYKNSV